MTEAQIKLKRLVDALALLMDPPQPSSPSWNRAVDELWRAIAEQ
jgi:hypothetical protein